MTDLKHIFTESQALYEIERNLKEEYPFLKTASVDMYANKEQNDISLVVKNKDIYFIGDGASQLGAIKNLIGKINNHEEKN